MEHQISYDAPPLLKGDFFSGEPDRLLYATDASAYREEPLGVARPAGKEDIKELVVWAGKQKLSLIPRGAGTSLAGQVVGNGIVVDVTRYMNRILEINTREQWVRVEPGIVLDDLNLELNKHGLFFAPETSTSNRCVIGGMIGNNSSGLHSLVYGTTREHLVSVKTILSDGSEAEFRALAKDEFLQKCELNNLEGRIYRKIKELLSNEENRKKILEEYPDPDVVRRNTGYALDELMKASAFLEGETGKFNFCKLLAGSEGTLAFITEAKLNLRPVPTGTKALLCVHFNSVMEAIKGNLVALKYRPEAIELMDNRILELTRENIEQRKNRFFVKGNPGAILMIELRTTDSDEINRQKERMEKEMREKGLGYHFPLVSGEDIKKVWSLRKAGLGILSNLPGPGRPVSVIEDTSVNPAHLESYITDFNVLLKKYSLECVYHAHISVGELHLRPILNLKDPEDVELFYTIARETARLVKKYKGSLSGEHGDGRLRGEFIPLMVGEEVYQWHKDIKQTWDPQNIFNPGKITDTPRMNTFLRYTPGEKELSLNTILDFSSGGGYMQSIERCNGSGDCRKSELMGGTMCPSYQATRDEYTTTRARANILREYIRKSAPDQVFNRKEIMDVLDLCLSCKGCKSECPSNVDMAKFKAEYLQHYYDSNPIPLRTKAIAYITWINRLGSLVPALYNFVASQKYLAGILKGALGFARERSIPRLHRYTLRRWLGKNLEGLNSRLPADAPEVLFFVDEFTNYNDTTIGIQAVKLLTGLGYRVVVTRNEESGRTYISKGLLRTARKKAIKNIILLRNQVHDQRPLVGIEPSAILSFRDEYPDLLRAQLKKDAREVAKNTFTIEEFLNREIQEGRIRKEQFTSEKKEIKLHGHCQQKAIASTAPDLNLLSFPENYTVNEIPSGCCGMAGSFGYEKEHYDLSMKVGELVLLPAVRSAGQEVLIAAPGTSCRHQIKDGTGRKALHPVSILYEALLEKPRV